MRITDTHIYFWKGWLSNWIPMNLAIKYDDYEFNTAEQLFMYKKAKFFSDEPIAARIKLLGKHPKDALNYGRKVRGYDDNKWSAVREQMMHDAVYAKFSQYPELKQKLIDTYPKILVEGTPFDPIWGVKISWDDDRILDEKNWNGQNLLGKVLMDVRQKLMDR
jgi:ribA/ribD-fused uncharacterized protein